MIIIIIVPMEMQMSLHFAFTIFKHAFVTCNKNNNNSAPLFKLQKSVANL